jgi:Domain of unknown function (DUF5658)
MHLFPQVGGDRPGVSALERLVLVPGVDAFLTPSSLVLKAARLRSLVAEQGSGYSGQTDERSATHPAASVCRRWRARRASANQLLLMLFVELQLADILSTNHALARPGVWEANPLMAWSQAKLGAAWWLPKLAIIGLVASMAYRSRRRWPILAMVSVSCAAVLINLAHV